MRAIVYFVPVRKKSDDYMISNPNITNILRHTNRLGSDFGVDQVYLQRGLNYMSGLFRKLWTPIQPICSKKEKGLHIESS